MPPEGAIEAFAIPTPRLVLRGWRETDFDALFSLCSDVRVMEFLGPVSSEADVRAMIERLRTCQADNGYCFWAVERREDGAVLGFCGLKPGQAGTPIEGMVEIGWRLAADAWGQGYAREAAQASLDWGWANLDADAIWAITTPANVRSWGLMERLGMRRHADLDFAFPGVAPDSPLSQCIIYSIGRPA